MVSGYAMPSAVLFNSLNSLRFEANFLSISYYYSYYSIDKGCFELYYNPVMF